MTAPSLDEATEAVRCIVRNHRHDRVGAIRVALALGIEQHLPVPDEDVTRVLKETLRAVS